MILVFQMQKVNTEFILSCIYRYAVGHAIHYIFSLEYFKDAMDKCISILKTAKDNIMKAQEKQKKDYDKQHYCSEIFNLDSLVLKKDLTRRKRKGEKLDTTWV